MAYYLDYTPLSGKYLQIPSGNGQATIAASQNFKLSLLVKKGGNVLRLMGSSTAGARLWFSAATTFTVTNNAAVDINFNIINNTSDFELIVIERNDNANIRFTVNGGQLSTVASTGAFTFNRLFADSLGVATTSGAIQHIELEKDGVVTNRWENTTGTGTALTDLIGTLPFNQVGTWPADNSEWVSYSAGGGDVDPPTFTVAPAASAIGQTSTTVTATINETGSIFWVAVPQGDATPSVAQVIAGQNAAGAAPIDAGSAIGTTSLSEVASGFTAATDYKFCVVARDDETTPNVQAAVTVVNFTTAAAGDTTPPVFTVAPAVTSISQTTATVSATIDETGSIFWVVVPNSESTPSVSQVIAGQNAAGGTPTDAGSAVGTTTLSEGVAGMTASTAYKACFVARDDEGTPNVQATVTTVGFTTAAVPTGTFTTGVLRRRVGGGVVANTAMTYFRLYNPTTGALVLNRTNLSSDANGRVTCTDATLTAGVEYKADWLAATGETRMSKKAAT